VKDADRFRLLGTYRTPRVKLGTVLTCEARDCDVIVVDYTIAEVRRLRGPDDGVIVG